MGKSFKLSVLENERKEGPSKLCKHNYLFSTEVSFACEYLGRCTTTKSNNMYRNVISMK